MKRIKSRKKKRLIDLAIVLAVLLFCWFENKHLTVTYYSYESSKLAQAFDGFRIVQISDLHNASFGFDNKNLLQKIKKLEPDIIVITGDIVDANHTNVDVAVDFAREAAKVCPAYYITGNHEDWLEEDEKELLIAQLREAGVICLEDEVIQIERDKSSFFLIGLNDASLIGGTLSGLVSDLGEDELKILLAHEPQYLERYSKCHVDLVLSGHAHGGQFRLPFVGGLVAPNQGFFPEYTEGTHTEGDTTMIISRGLGNSIIPVRLFNLPEIVCVDLKAE